MKNATRMLSWTLAVCLLLLTLASCKTQYDIVIYDDRADDLIREDFLAANRTRGAYDGLESEAAGEEYPATRFFIVDTEAAYDEIFKPEANIPAEFYTGGSLIIITYTSNYPRSVSIETVRKNGTALELTLREEAPRRGCAAVGDACMPYQRYVVFRTGGETVQDVTFTVKY